MYRRSIGSAVRGGWQMLLMTFVSWYGGLHGTCRRRCAGSAEAVLEATLSDCKRVSDAIMHAVHWDNPEIIAQQLVSACGDHPAALKGLERTGVPC
jgi:hypothetical protein